MLTWASPFNICCFLDNQGYPSPVFECLLAVGAAERFTAAPGRAFADLRVWAADRKEWLFGHFAYDLATETEPAAPPTAPPAPPPDPIGFPALFFFVPEIVISLQQDSIRIGSLGPAPEAIWQAMRAAIPRGPATSAGSAISGQQPAAAPPAPIGFEARFSREEYLETINLLRRHILRGDCYEINFCQEFYAESASLDPWAAWQALSQASPNPFSAFYRLDDRYLLCASPERFLKKTGSTLLAQPIKGTAPRVRDDEAADQRAGLALAASSKDQAENVMVVDLVRNDLSKICRPGSVRVSELFGIYAFPQVYQMISTITGELLPGRHWWEAIRDTFPMGSMTGAPKNNVVRLIARYERSRRGIFSGALGYVTPDGDFDFNVVIRSLLYRQDTGYLSYQVGSGITYNSDPAAEYEECLLKAQGIRKALGIDQ